MQLSIWLAKAKLITVRVRNANPAGGYLSAGYAIFTLALRAGGQIRIET
jgi:hypothetical protein